MLSNQRKFHCLAGVCDCLAQTASSPEQREKFLHLAEKWRAMASGQSVSEVPLRDEHRSAVNEWLSSAIRPRS